MTKSGITIKSLASLIFAFALCSTAQAQTRTFVSGLGSDANACTRISPCRSFQRAFDVVNAGGEVIAIDSAGYGPITITKSVSIIGDGNYAGINTSSGDGVTIAAAGITVKLRSLTIEGLGSGSYGIFATDFKALHIEHCTVSGFTSGGVWVDPTNPANVFIKDSISRNNGANGIDFRDNVRGFIENTRVDSNTGDGIYLSGPVVRVTAHRFLSVANNIGFDSVNGAELNLEGCVAANNGSIGMLASGGIMRVSNSIVTNNTTFGFSNNSGTFESRGNNTLAGNNNNGAQTSGTITGINGY